MDKKSPEAFRTISEVAEWLGTPTHVLRFWESRFAQVRPVKRAGGRRYYRPADMMLLGGIKKLLHEDGMTIRGVQKLLREKGVKHVASLSPPLDAGFGEAIESGGETVVIEAPFAEVPEAEEVRGPAPVVDIGTARSEREGTAQRQEDTPEEPASAPYPFARPRVPFAEHSASRDSQTADTGQADVAKEPAGDGEPAPQPQAAEPDMSAESKAPQAKAAAGSGEGPAAAPTPDPMAFEAVMEALREGARPAPAAIAPILTRLETLRASFETPPAGSGDGPNG